MEQTYLYNIVSCMYVTDCTCPLMCLVVRVWDVKSDFIHKKKEYPTVGLRSTPIIVSGLNSQDSRMNTEWFESPRGHLNRHRDVSAAAQRQELNDVYVAPHPPLSPSH